MSQGSAARAMAQIPEVEPPLLLCEPEPWGRIFLRNLGDLLLRRQPPPLVLTARPIPVRATYFIRTGIDGEGFVESFGLHIVLITIVYLAYALHFFSSPQLRSPLENARVEYYPPVSEYLPPINTVKAGRTRHGAPKLAKQEILSVPPNPDNTRQTIITPPKIKLIQDVATPNIVAWTPVPSTQPVAASQRSASQLKVPQFDVPVVQPTADVAQLKTKLQLPTVLEPSVVEPVVSPDQLKFQRGQLNIAQMEPTVVAPKLPVRRSRPAASAQRRQECCARAQRAEPGRVAGQGQIIALGLNPTSYGAPAMPSGNRSGEFHASPSGKPDAPGTPNVAGTAPMPAAVRHTAPAAAPRNHGGQSAAGHDDQCHRRNGGKATGIPGANSNLEAQKNIIAAAMKPTLPSYRDRQPPPPEH